MSAIHKTIHVLRHKERDIGESSTVEGLQKICDIFSDTLVETIQASRPLHKEAFCIEIRTKHLDENGMYLSSDQPPIVLENKHSDFFRYLLTYTRDLYADRAADEGATNILLASIEKKTDLQREIMRFEKSWYNEQLVASKVAGVGLTIRHFPVCDAAVELATLNANVIDALEVLVRKSLLVKDPFIPSRKVVLYGV